MKHLKEYFSGVIELLYPRICAACNKSLSANDLSLCASCLSKMPETHFHEDPENETAKIFWGRIEIANATSFIRFEKGGMVQQIMHHLKYKGHKQLGVDLGKAFGNKIKNTGFSSCDLIVPVPLHKNRLKERGYNQSSMIAEGLSSIMNIPFEDKILIRKKRTGTQTRLKKYERWENVKNVFQCKNPGVIHNKHILLLDDVITTGATIEACGRMLLEAGAKELSVATLCYAN